MDNLFWKQKTRGKMIKIDEKNLKSDWISHIIKSRRLWEPEQSIAMADLLLRKKLVTKDYLMYRALIFAYEDGSLECIKTVSAMLLDYRTTKIKGMRTNDWIWVTYDSGEWDLNIFRRIFYLNAILPKRRETEEWVWWLKALDEWIVIRKQREKQKQIELPSYSVDKHSKTGRVLKEQWIELDERYSGNEYGNSYMEAEYQKYENLNPNRIDIELEEMITRMYYHTF